MRSERRRWGTTGEGEERAAWDGARSGGSAPAPRRSGCAVSERTDARVLSFIVCFSLLTMATMFFRSDSQNISDNLILVVLLCRPFCECFYLSSEVPTSNGMMIKSHFLKKNRNSGMVST